MDLLVLIVCGLALAFTFLVLAVACSGPRRPMRVDLVEYLRRDLSLDPGDGPLLDLEVNLFAQDLAELPTGVEPSVLSHPSDRRGQD